MKKSVSTYVRDGTGTAKVFVAMWSMVMARVCLAKVAVSVGLAQLSGNVVWIIQRASRNSEAIAAASSEGSLEANAPVVYAAVPSN